MSCVNLRFARNHVTQAIRDARSTYINMTLSRNKNNPRKFWRIINALCKNTDRLDYDGDFVDPATGVTVPTDTISLFLNDYFANIGSRLNTLNGIVLDDLDDIYPEMKDMVFDFPVVDRYDILLLQKEIDVHKASCIPEIRSDICKYLFGFIPERIADLFNASLSSGVYPSDWSFGYVNLIPKQGRLSDPSNWRPITQTNIFGKNLEKIVHKHLLSYFLHHGVISDRQYVFLPGRSTHEAIFDLVRHIFFLNCNNKTVDSISNHLEEHVYA